jgi:hypothetical protein
MEEVCERENLKAALRQVKGNKGSAGVDGITRFSLSPATPRAAPVSAEEKSSTIWIFCCLWSLRLMAYSPLLLVRAFSVAGCRVGGGALAR